MSAQRTSVPISSAQGIEQVAATKIMETTTSIPIQQTDVREFISQPVVSTTTNPGLASGTSYATPCHPVTGATGPYPKAVPLQGTTTAYPGMTTYEQTSGLPTSTHMYGVPLATYTKGPGGVVTPVATGTTGPLSGQPIVETSSFVTPVSDATLLGGGRQTTTHVTDTYTPVGTSAVPGTKGRLGTAIPDDVGVHHHDRSHHHHVHDRLPLGTQQTGMMGATNTGAPAVTAPGSTAHTMGAKAVGDKEHQIIQDVIPPGRNRVVEHHEKY